jgi:hypothetical protein
MRAGKNEKSTTTEYRTIGDVVTGFGDSDYTSGGKAGHE